MSVAEDLLIEWQGGDRVALRLGRLTDVVIEAGDPDPTVRALEGRDDLRDGEGRVADRSAVAAGVEIAISEPDVDLRIRHAAQRQRDRRDVPLEEPGVADDRGVPVEAIAMLGQPRLEMRAPAFLFALEDVLDVDRQAVARREQCRCCTDVGVDLALVVGGAAADQPMAVDHRLERVGAPLCERVDRLDVVVTVDEDGRSAIGVQPIAVDHRMAAGLADLDVLDTGSTHLVREPLGGPTDVRGVLRQRRDAGDAEERLEAFEALLTTRFEVRVEDLVGGGRVGHGPEVYRWGPLPVGRMPSRAARPCMCPGIERAGRGPARSKTGTGSAGRVRPAAASAPGWAALDRRPTARRRPPTSGAGR